MPGKVVRDVAAWLKTQGYPLEYETARILRSAGFRVEQGRHWMDTDPFSDEPVPREIDVLATAAPDDWPAKRGAAAVQLVVECKHGTGPWIVMAGSRGAATMGELLIGERGLRKWADERRTLPGLLGSRRPIGFGVTEKRHPDAAPAAYEAVMEATRAAYKVRSTDWPLWVLPVVVVDGALLALSYDGEGHESLREVERARLSWSGAALRSSGGMLGGSVMRQEPVLVEIVQRSALERFAVQAWRTAEAVRAMVKPE